LGSAFWNLGQIVSSFAAESYSPCSHTTKGRTSVRRLEDNTLLLLVILVSLAFAWILWPFFGAVLWAAVLAIVFAPLHLRLLKVIPERRNLTAFATVLIVVTLVILPLMLTAASLVREAASLQQKIQSDTWDPATSFQQFLAALPAWATDLLDRLGLKDLSAVQQRLSAALVKGSTYFAREALDIGLGTVSFLVSFVIMLYLLFFFLRDGDAISKRITDAIPLPADQQQALIKRSTTVIRAMVKGNLMVAAVQGALGGFIFWVLGIHTPVLWAAVMALLSLLPAAGTAVVWLPVAIYLLVTGAVWQGVVLLAYGTFVMGFVDNFLQPLLVGKGTQMPDYVVLISTLGAIAMFGLSGFIVGPVVAALFIAVWDIFSASRQRRLAISVN
jgi:predicted PurR-regulated permease PerM